MNAAYRSTKKVDYDTKYDVLYIMLSDTSNSYGDEDPDGIVVFKDIDTDQITGVTIFDFSTRFSNPAMLKCVLPSSINFNADILPLLH